MNGGSAARGVKSCPQREGKDARARENTRAVGVLVVTLRGWKGAFSDVAKGPLEAGPFLLLRESSENPGFCGVDFAADPKMAKMATSPLLSALFLALTWSSSDAFHVHLPLRPLPTFLHVKFGECSDERSRASLVSAGALPSRKALDRESGLRLTDPRLYRAGCPALARHPVPKSRDPQRCLEALASPARRKCGSDTASSSGYSVSVYLVSPIW